MVCHACILKSLISSMHFVELHFWPSTACCRLVSWLAIISLGTEPESGDGFFKVKLSEESGNVLAKLEGIKRWRVQPTMVRGAKKAGTGSMKFAFKRFGARRRRKDVGKKDGKKKVSKHNVKKHEKQEDAEKGKSKSKGHIPEIKAPDELGPQDIRRTPEGRKAICSIMEHIYEIDLQEFSSAPVFDSEGKCRMKFPNADSFSWPELLNASGHAVEAMRLGIL